MKIEKKDGKVVLTATDEEFFALVTPFVPHYSLVKCMNKMADDAGLGSRCGNPTCPNCVMLEVGRVLTEYAVTAVKRMVADGTFSDATAQLAVKTLADGAAWRACVSARRPPR